MQQTGLFHELVLEVMVDFRRILKRYYPKDERDALLTRFDLKRKRAYDSDLELYNAAQAILVYWTEQIETKPRRYYAYSGVEQYYVHLKDFMSQYYVSGRKVEHKSQRIWRVMLDIIQQVSAMTLQSDENKATQLKQNCLEIAYYGSKDQKQRLSEILVAKSNELPTVFLGILEAFRQTIAAKDQESAA